MNYSEFKTTVYNYYHTAKVPGFITVSDRVHQVKDWLCKYHFETVCKFFPPYSENSELPYSPKKLHLEILNILFQ